MNKYIKDYEIALKYAFTNRTHDDTLDALIAAVNANPHRIEPRAMLSDELQEKGHFHDMPEAHRNLIEDYRQPKHVWVNRQGQVRALPHKTPLESAATWHSMLGDIDDDDQNHELYTRAANWLDENGHAGLSRLFDMQANRLRDRSMGGRYDEYDWGLPSASTYSSYGLLNGATNVGKGGIYTPLPSNYHNHITHHIEIVTNNDPWRMRVLKLYGDRGHRSFVPNEHGETDHLTDEEAADIKHSLEQ